MYTPIIEHRKKTRATTTPNNDRLELDGIWFVGSTLWTDFKLYGEGEAWFARQRAKRLIEDFAAIRNDKRRFAPEDCVAVHETSKAWLVGEQEIAPRSGRYSRSGRNTL